MNNFLKYGIQVSKRSSDVLLGDLLFKFLYLWNGRYSGHNSLSNIDETSITVSGKDWSSKHIPDTSATFSVPVGYLSADTDNFWFSTGTPLQKTFTELIESATLRTFVKYTDFEPYTISAIGILKPGEVLTEDDKILLTSYFKLWTQYWGETMMDTGYMKDNRILI